MCSEPSEAHRSIERLDRDYHASNSCSGRWVGGAAAVRVAAAGGRLRRACDADRWRSPARRAAAGTTVTSGPALSKGRRGVRSNCVGESSWLRPSQAVFFYHGGAPRTSFACHQAPGCRVVRRNRGPSCGQAKAKPPPAPAQPLSGQRLLQLGASGAHVSAQRARGGRTQDAHVSRSRARQCSLRGGRLGAARAALLGTWRKQILSTAQGKFAWLLLAHGLPFKEGPNNLTQF